MKTVMVHGKVYKSFFLTDNELSRIGAEKTCSCCGESFTVGEAELYKFSHDPKGNPVNRIELCTPSEHFVTVKLTGKNATPVDFSQYTVTEQAILFGVEYLNMHLCRTCTIENSEYSTDGAGIMTGSGERSGFGSGEMESN